MFISRWRSLLCVGFCLFFINHKHLILTVLEYEKYKIKVPIDLNSGGGPPFWLASGFLLVMASMAFS